MIGLFIVLEALYRSFGRVIGDWYGLEYWVMIGTVFVTVSQLAYWILWSMII